MPAWTLLVVAVGVSADAFAVALGRGLHVRRLAVRDVAAIALAFGLFQGLMPLVGWAVGTRLADAVAAVDHWVAFGLLALVGGSMLREALQDDGDDAPGEGRVGPRELLTLSVATSVDALAVGVGFAFLDVPILLASVVIAATTAAISAVGVVVGHRIGLRLRRPAEVAGGVVLVLIGLHILLEHLGVL